MVHPPAFALRLNILLGAALLVAAFAAPPSAYATSPGCSPPWGLVRSPNPGDGTDDFLYGIAASSPSDAWAVGYWIDSVNSRSGPLVEHWDGSRWTAQRVSVGSRYGVLNEVAVVSASDAWAVGSRQDLGSAAEPLILHWDGAKWAQVSAPNPDSHGTTLLDVEAISAGDVWAVGYYYSTPYEGSQRTFTLHWDGTGWTNIPSPNQGTLANFLEGVTGASAQDVWAVGKYWPGDIESATLAMHWDGSVWSITTTPNPGTASNGFGGVAVVAANDVWAVGGYSQAGEDADPLAEHWNGVSWSVVSVSSPGGGGFADIAKVPRGRLVAVGADLANRTLIAAWDGREWRISRSANYPGNSQNILLSVASTSPEDIWAVGYRLDDGTTRYLTLVEHHCPFRP